MFKRFRSGQTMLEYVLVVSALLVVSAALWGLVSVVVRHGERTQALVAAECP